MAFLSVERQLMCLRILRDLGEISTFILTLRLFSMFAVKSNGTCVTSAGPLCTAASLLLGQSNSFAMVILQK